MLEAKLIAFYRSNYLFKTYLTIDKTLKCSFLSTSATLSSLHEYASPSLTASRKLFFSTRHQEQSIIAVRARLPIKRLRERKNNGCARVRTPPYRGTVWKRKHSHLKTIMQRNWTLIFYWPLLYNNIIIQEDGIRKITFLTPRCPGQHLNNVDHAHLVNNTRTVISIHKIGNQRSIPGRYTSLLMLKESETTHICICQACHQVLDQNSGKHGYIPRSTIKLCNNKPPSLSIDVQKCSVTGYTNQADIKSSASINLDDTPSDIIAFDPSDLLANLRLIIIMHNIIGYINTSIKSPYNALPAMNSPSHQNSLTGTVQILQ